MSPKRRRHTFAVDHQVSQALLLKGLNAIDDPNETPEETARITAMQVQLERLIARRLRRRSLKSRGANSTGIQS